MGTYQANIFGKKRTKSVDFGESGKMQFWSPNSYLVQEKNGGGTLHEIIGNSFTRPNLTLFYHQKMGRSKKKSRITFAQLSFIFERSIPIHALQWKN